MLSTDGSVSTVLSASADGSVTTIRHFEEFPDMAFAGVIRPGNQGFLLCIHDGGKLEVQTAEGYISDIACLKNDSGSFFFTGSNDGRITAVKINGESFEMVDSKQATTPSPVTTLAVMGMMVFGGCKDGQLLAWDLASGNFDSMSVGKSAI